MKKILKKLKHAKKIALFSHLSADPDTIGSTLALYYALKSLKKEVSCFCDDDTLEKFDFLDATKIYNIDDINSDFDLFVAIDIANADRLGKFEEIFSKNKNMRIDHHKSGDNFAELNFMKPHSACSVLIFEILKKLKVKITKEIATLLYFGICGDTGGFRYNNTDALTFGVCEKLLNFGADIRRVYNEFFDKKTTPVLKLTSYVLMNAQTNEDIGYAILKLSKDDYQKFGVDETEYVGNLPNLYLNCGYKIAFIVKEKSDGIRVSLRSKYNYDCSLIAEQFGGGGHRNASGINFENKSFDEVLTLVENAVAEFIKNFNNGEYANEN